MRDHRRKEKEEADIENLDAVALFLDTHILLHFKRYDEIDWPKLVGSQKVELVFPPVILRELQKHKTFPPTKRIGHRAADVLSKLDKDFDQGSNVDIRPNVRLRFEPRKPSVDFTSLDLDPRDNDHELIASVLMYQQENPNAPAVLATNDVGSKYTAKPLGITVFSLDDEFSLKGEQDPLEKQNAELLRDNKELKQRIPVIDIAFQTADEKVDNPYLITLEMSPAAVVSEAEIEAELAKEYQEHWPIGANNPHLPMQVGASRLASERATYFLYGQGDSYVKTYNANVESYFEAMKDYFGDIVRYDERVHRTFAIFLKVTVGGSAPAENADVMMWFPPDVKICELERLPAIPMRPSAPLRPSPRGYQSSGQKIFYETIQSNSPQTYRQQEVERERNRLRELGPEIVRVVPSPEDVMVSIPMQTLKHTKEGIFYPVTPIAIEFETYQNMRSFGIECTLSASNLPNPKDRRLDVRLEKTERSMSGEEFERMVQHYERQALRLVNP